MRISIDLDRALVRRVRTEARRRGCTIAELVTAALRAFLTPHAARADLRPLPAFDGGPLLVDVSDRDALERAMGREP